MAFFASIFMLGVFAGKYVCEPSSSFQSNSPHVDLSKPISRIQVINLAIMRKRSYFWRMKERKRSENKLKLLEFCIDNIGDAIYWLTMDGRFWNVNAAACEMLGYSREELLSLSVHDIDTDYAYEVAQSDLEKVKRTGFLQLKRFHTAKDGRIIPVEITSNYFAYNNAEYLCCIVRDMTERFKAEKEASFFRTLIEYTRDPVYVVSHTKGSRLVYVNEAACLHYGREREELLTMRTFDLDATLEQEDINELHEELKKNKSLHFETMHRVASGDLVPVNVTANYLELDGDELAVGHFHDLSERRLMEYELRQAHDELEKRVEERTVELRTANELLQHEITERKRGEEALLFSRLCIDKAAIGIFHTNENGTIFSVNDYACASLGYSKDELCALSVFDIDPVITHEKMFEIKKMLDETGLATHETTHKRRDGTTFPVEITANILEFQGKTFGISFVKDITERKRAEEALRASEAEKSLILNSTMDYVIYHDPDIKIVWANWKAGKLANLPVEELTGRHCWEVLHRRDKPCEGCPVVLARETGEPQKMEMRLTNGLIVFMRAYPIKSDQGRLLGIVEHAIDITEQKRVEEALQKAHGELESRVRERTEQLTSLAAELSLAEERERRRIATELHDQVGQSLILSKIKLDSLSCSLPSESFGKLVGEIREYLNQSIEEIRSLTFQLSPPLLYEVGFEAAVEWLGEEFEEKYGFQVEFKDDGSKKPLNEETSVALYQMVRELLLNIAKHSKAKKVRISVAKVSDKIKIIVADDGSGFDRTKNMWHGNKKRGFGLFNIRHRIEYMGGELAIESEIEQGTRVSLLFPLKNKKLTNRKTL